MLFDELEKYILNKGFVMKKFIDCWKCIRYTLMDEMFALVSIGDNNRVILSVRAGRYDLDAQKNDYPNAIFSGTCISERFWNSVYLDAKIEDAYLLKMIDASYKIIESNYPQPKPSEKCVLNIEYKNVKNGFDFNGLLFDKNFSLMKYLQENGLNFKK